MEETKDALQVDIVCEDKELAPVYATLYDCCMDLKARIIQEGKSSITIPAGDYAAFGTGIKVKVPVGYGLFILPRSSTGIKMHCELENTVGVVDAGYRDEIKIVIRNKGDKPITIENKQRICQMMILPRPIINWNFVKDDASFQDGNRGGGIGSTGQ